MLVLYLSLSLRSRASFTERRIRQAVDRSNYEKWRSPHRFSMPGSTPFLRLTTALALFSV